MCLAMPSHIFGCVVQAEAGGNEIYLYDRTYRLDRVCWAHNGQIDLSAVVFSEEACLLGCSCVQGTLSFKECLRQPRRLKEFEMSPREWRCNVEERQLTDSERRVKGFL